MIAPTVAGFALLVVGVATMAGWLGWAGLGRWLAQHAGPVVLLSAGAGLLVTAGVWHVRLRRASRWERDARWALSWWSVAAVCVVVVGVAWGATDWLLGEAAGAKDPAVARVDAIKTGLGIAAGTGGVFALLLAVRRQWHQERATASTTHDATERRVTELYTKAADQLGSDKAPVRLAGLYALERVAQDNPGQRQTVVNVLCAYLRMPYTLPRTSPRRLGNRRPRRTSAPAAATPPVVGADTARQELEVRLTAQRILIKHLHPGPDPIKTVGTFWQDIDLDLTGATLHNWSMDGCRAHQAVFARANFIGRALFSRTQFTGVAVFDAAQFTGIASFAQAQFTGGAAFGGARFAVLPTFTEVRFPGPHAGAGFTGTRFEGGKPPEIAELQAASALILADGDPGADPG